MLSTKINTAIAVSISTAVILACSFTVTYLINDINSLYDDIISNLDEIRDINRDAWHNMMNMQQKAGGRNSDIRNLFEFRRIRNKRASSNCNCEQNRGKNCPKGSPGPAGDKGEPGEAGEPGIPGLPGATGTTVLLDLPHAGCIRCPAGPPGSRGPPGQSGHPGNVGPRGNPGRNGRDGNRGPPGTYGDLGPPGRDGPPGLDGRRGQDGTRWILTPGFKGRSGNPGYHGPQGDRGQNGGPGQPGQQGPAGQPGYRGNPGRAGLRGPPGNSGFPGRNGGYCPCPNRSEAIPAQNNYPETDNGHGSAAENTVPSTHGENHGPQIEVPAAPAGADYLPSESSDGGYGPEASGGGNEYKKSI